MVGHWCRWGVQKDPFSNDLYSQHLTVIVSQPRTLWAMLAPSGQPASLPDVLHHDAATHPPLPPSCRARTC
ncbi:hypothetical protein M433DRAFT_152917 [Acidomyces richmondensis BFW]|nr:MAG: hypothetical protein FE78DRAFT_84504 [Acidomyces sp. 'richmondensis']KYG46832.1 hypothetical protein M433DRAFT_152917 [Acidomyces richmondensis BFW]